MVVRKAVASRKWSLILDALLLVVLVWLAVVQWQLLQDRDRIDHMAQRTCVNQRAGQVLLRRAAHSDPYLHWIEGLVPRTQGCQT